MKTQRARCAGTRGLLWPGGLLGLVRFGGSSAAMVRLLRLHLVDYPTPVNLSWAWNWGSLSGLAYAWQLLSGVFVAMQFGVDSVIGLQAGRCGRSVVGAADVLELGSCVPAQQQRGLAGLARDVSFGRHLRAAHANGASFFFVAVYVHLIRSFYYASWRTPSEWVWLLGLAILFLMILTAFIGYVLPWGQMSLWGATVITSLASAVPLVGWSIHARWQVVFWLWGGFSVDAPTVSRFFSLHYMLPFLLAGFIALHLAMLHRHGSTNPLGMPASVAPLRFHPYYVSEDLVALVLFLVPMLCFVGIWPDALGHPDNFIPANPYATPAHIVPEWYFLWVYAVLRSIPSKAAGVMLVGFVFLSLAFLSFVQPELGLGSPQFRCFHVIWFWTFLADLGILVSLGAGAIEPASLSLGQFASCFLVCSLSVALPVLGAAEHDSIAV